MNFKQCQPYSGWAFSGLLKDEGGIVKKSPFPKICHTYPTMMKLGTVIPYLKKFQKLYESRDTPLEFCWHQHFFTGNQQILLHQEIQIEIEFWYIISNAFNFSWVFNNCFNKRGHNFDDVSKNGYSRPSQNKDILKKRVWRHNFCPWRYQPNFITCFKLQCKCGHVTKVW